MIVETSTERPLPELDYSISDSESGPHRDWSFHALEDETLRLVTRRPGACVLDVTCGTGKQTIRIAERGARRVPGRADMIIALWRKR
jgi:2-polyprenyl-3-methyl-5-hydroxy-6-metoxy-1,4-benzoquinol methylase